VTDRVRLAAGVVAVVMLGLGLWRVLPTTETDLLADTEAALAAWARFASTGDLAEIEGFFVANGPQHTELVGEAVSRRVGDGEPYVFRLEAAEAVGPGLVSGRVVVERSGTVTHTAHWEIELRLHDGRWQIWTVRSDPAGKASVAPPSFASS
jgi:hypothetical protein